MINNYIFILYLTPPSAPPQGGGDSPGRGVLKDGGVYII
jgi:hypothetical protein